MEIKLLHITPNAETLIEEAGRTCYNSFASFDPPKSTEVFIRNLISRGHFSVLEHAIASFRLAGVSRVLTHELVRQRLSSFSQMSQRYVKYGSGERETEFRCVVPPTIADNDTVTALTSQGAPMTVTQVFSAAADFCRIAYEALVKAGVPPEDARYLLPGGSVTEIVITANLRQWRHILELRCSPRAAAEIRSAMISILQCLQQHCPNVFCDFVIDVDRNCATRSK